MPPSMFEEPWGKRRITKLESCCQEHIKSWSFI